MSYTWALLYLKVKLTMLSTSPVFKLKSQIVYFDVSKVFAVDIHPAAKIGEGILLDHGTGVVIGETAIVGNKVSLMQGVTLGGTGKEIGNRHPKIGQGALIGASATILGNITIGEGAMVAAGSLVLKSLPPHSMAAGNPAKVVGYVEDQDPSLTMNHDATKEFFEQVAVGSMERRPNEFTIKNKKATQPLFEGWFRFTAVLLLHTPLEIQGVSIVWLSLNWQPLGSDCSHQMNMAFEMDLTNMNPAFWPGQWSFLIGGTKN
ncbi:serine/threonine-protein kinase HAL4/sat4 [Asimina triloba]